MRNILFLVTSAASLLASLAGAQQLQAPRGALFISPMGQPFRASDGQTGLQKWFAQADADHDGKISLAEFVADADAALAHADSNGDGSVVSTEATSLWAREAPEVLDVSASYDAPLAGNDPNTNSSRQHHRNNSDDVPVTTDEAPTGTRIVPGDPNALRGPRPLGAQAFGLLGDAEPIMSCDSNFDRRIEKTEFEQCAGRRFVQLDLNHDGFFTADEVRPWLTARGRAGR